MESEEGMRVERIVILLLLTAARVVVVVNEEAPERSVIVFVSLPEVTSMLWVEVAALGKAMVRV